MQPDDRTETDAAELSTAGVTSEVGSEGGSPGDVEILVSPPPARGSEATETWHRPPGGERITIFRDDPGPGRRRA
jgi:hypothetical protein